MVSLKIAGSLDDSTFPVTNIVLWTKGRYDVATLSTLEIEVLRSLDWALKEVTVTEWVDLILLESPLVFNFNVRDRAKQLSWECYEDIQLAHFSGCVNAVCCLLFVTEQQGQLDLMRELLRFLGDSIGLEQGEVEGALDLLRQRMNRVGIDEQPVRAG